MGDRPFHPNGFLLCKLDLGSGRHILLVNLHPDCEDEDTRMEEFRVWEEKAMTHLSVESPQVDNHTTMPKARPYIYEWKCKIFLLMVWD